MQNWTISFNAAMDMPLQGSYTADPHLVIHIHKQVILNISDVHHTSEWTFSSLISRLSLPLVFGCSMQAGKAWYKARFSLECHSICLEHSNIT